MNFVCAFNNFQILQDVFYRMSRALNLSGKIPLGSFVWLLHTLCCLSSFYFPVIIENLSMIKSLRRAEIDIAYVFPYRYVDEENSHLGLCDRMGCAMPSRKLEKCSTILNATYLLHTC